MDEYTFSPAEYEEIPEIADIYKSLVGTPGCTWNEYYPNAETAEEDIGGGSLYTLKKNGRIIAVASAGDFGELGHLRWTPEKPCEMARIGVVPEMQNKGIGALILKHVINAMREKGFDGVRMLVSKDNAAALALYDRNGFERCGETNMFDHDFYCYQKVF